MTSFIVKHQHFKSKEFRQNFKHPRSERNYFQFFFFPNIIISVKIEKSAAILRSLIAEPNQHFQDPTTIERCFQTLSLLLWEEYSRRLKLIEMQCEMQTLRCHQQLTMSEFYGVRKAPFWRHAKRTLILFVSKHFLWRHWARADWCPRRLTVTSMIQISATRLTLDLTAIHQSKAILPTVLAIAEGLHTRATEKGKGQETETRIDSERKRERLGKKKAISASPLFYKLPSDGVNEI